MTELKANCLKIGGVPMDGRRHKAEFAGGGGDAMQVKRKKLCQYGVSMKRLKEAHFKVELQGKLQRV